MAYDLLTTSGINNLVNSYVETETKNRLNPVKTRKTYYESLNSAYSTLSSKLGSLKTLLADLKSTETTSLFNAKAAVSSNTKFVSVNASNGALDGSHAIRVNQLAKNDLVLSQDLSSSGLSSVITSPGTHQFQIKTGDGDGGEFVSNVSVTFVESDFTAGQISHSDLMTKIQAAINSDKAVVESSSVTGSTIAAGSFVLDLNGTETTINYSAGTYSDVIDSIVGQINDLTGVSAEKIVDGSNYRLKITVADSSKYITLKNDTSTLLSEMNLSVTKEKGASGIVTASVFSPASSASQLSLTAKSSGYDNRILFMGDSGAGNNALASIGLNLGATRTAFVQNSGIDTAGYVYTTDLLNSKFEFNGVNIERNTNSVSDLISNTVVNLVSEMEVTDTTVNLSISTNVNSIKEKIQEFITKFNDVYTYLRQNSKSSSTSRGLLLGDSSASSLTGLFSTIAYSSVTGISSNEINTLSKLGISFNIDSGLSLSDSSRLETALKENLDQVKNLFTSANGIATTLYDRINPYLGTDGYLAKSQATFGSTITSLNDTITSVQSRIDKRAENLRQQYIKLQMQLAELLSSQSYFSSSNSFFG